MKADKCHVSRSEQYQISIAFFNSIAKRILIVIRNSNINVGKCMLEKKRGIATGAKNLQKLKKLHGSIFQVYLVYGKNYICRCCLQYSLFLLYKVMDF